MRPLTSNEPSPDTGMAAPQLTRAGAVMTAVGAVLSKITTCTTSGAERLPAASSTMSCTVWRPGAKGDAASNRKVCDGSGVTTAGPPSRLHS